MPVPGRRLEADMMIGLELALDGADQADGEEGGADDDMEAVKASRHEEGRGIDAVGEAERRMAVFPSLQAGEAEAERHGAGEAANQVAAVVMDQRMVRPG